MKWYLKVLKDYATFSGRARRSEYWFFVLFNMIFGIIAILIDNIMGTKFQIGSQTLLYGYIYMFYVLALFLPSSAVLVRRLHDVGKSGWFFFIFLIPIIGWIWGLVLLFKDSDSLENKYGANPKSIAT